MKKFVRWTAWAVLLPFVAVGFATALVVGAISFGFKVLPEILEAVTDWINDE